MIPRQCEQRVLSKNRSNSGTVLGAEVNAKAFDPGEHNENNCPVLFAKNSTGILMIK